MAKRRSVNHAVSPVEQKIVDFAEELGGLLGRAQEKAQSWLSQRDQVATTLASIRDTATRLLEDISMGASEATSAAQRGYQRGRGSTETRTGPTRAASSDQPTTKRKRTVSAATRKKMAAAQKARWAKIKKGKN